MAKPIVVKWSEMKAIVDSRNLSVQYVELSDVYKLTVIDGPYTLIMDLDKNPSDITDLIDFETNYKPNGNGRVREESFTTDRRLRVETSESSNSVELTRELMSTLKDIKNELKLINKHLFCISDQDINIEDDIKKE